LWCENFILIEIADSITLHHFTVHQGNIVSTHSLYEDSKRNVESSKLIVMDKGLRVAIFH